MQLLDGLGAQSRRLLRSNRLLGLGHVHLLSLHIRAAKAAPGAQVRAEGDDRRTAASGCSRNRPLPCSQRRVGGARRAYGLHSHHCLHAGQRALFQSSVESHRLHTFPLPGHLGFRSAGRITGTFSRHDLQLFVRSVFRHAGALFADSALRETRRCLASLVGLLPQ